MSDSGDVKNFIGERVDEGMSVEDTIQATQEAFAVLDKPWIDEVDADWIEEVYLEFVRRSK